MSGFTLSSETFHGQVPTENVYHDFGADGENKSPAIEWKNAPEGTQSFIITLHDPDAPGPGGWWHWCVFNIPSSVSSLPTDASGSSMPDGSIEVKNSYGSSGFGGACPPPGDTAHAYHLTLYALDTASLELDETASPAMVLFVADAHIIGKTGLTAYYSR